MQTDTIKITVQSADPAAGGIAGDVGQTFLKSTWQTKTEKIENAHKTFLEILRTTFVIRSVIDLSRVQWEIFSLFQGH